MPLDPLLLALLLLLAAIGFVVFLFLPPIIELVKPRDSGPRKMSRTPMQKTIRNESASRSTPRHDSADNSVALNNLQDVLKRMGVATQRIGNDILRIFGDLTLPAHLEVADNIVVEGSLTVKDGCVFHGNVKAKRDIVIGNSVVMKGNLVSNGNVEIKDESVVGCSVHADGSVRLGEKVYIGLSVVAGGDVELYENSEVKKNILTQGVIKVLKHPRLNFPSCIDDIG